MIIYYAIINDVVDKYILTLIMFEKKFETKKKITENRKTMSPRACMPNKLILFFLFRGMIIIYSQS